MDGLADSEIGGRAPVLGPSKHYVIRLDQDCEIIEDWAGVAEGFDSFEEASEFARACASRASGVYFVICNSVAVTTAATGEVKFPS